MFWSIGENLWIKDYYIMAPVEEDIIFYLRNGRMILEENEVEKKVKEIISKLHEDGMKWEINIAVWVKVYNRDKLVDTKERSYKSMSFEEKKLQNFIKNMRKGDKMIIYRDGLTGKVFIDFWRTVRR